MKDLRPHDLKLGHRRASRSVYFKADDRHIEHIVKELADRFSVEGDDRRALHDYIAAEFDCALNDARLAEVTARSLRFYRWMKEECRALGISVTTMLTDMEIKVDRLATWRKKVPSSVEVSLLIEEYIIRARANGIRRAGHITMKEFEAHNDEG
jgi:hypothetical protein